MDEWLYLVMILKRTMDNTNHGYADSNNEVHDNSKYVDDRKVKSYFYFEVTVLIHLLFLTLCYLDDNKSIDRTIGKIKD